MVKPAASCNLSVNSCETTNKLRNLAVVKLCSYWYCVQAASQTAVENPQKRGFILAAKRLISLSLLGLKTLL
jgi:hypothetical protein